jgi:hypothetical protein
MKRKDLWNRLRPVKRPTENTQYTWGTRADPLPAVTLDRAIWQMAQRNR